MRRHRPSPADARNLRVLVKAGPDVLPWSGLVEKLASTLQLEPDVQELASDHVTEALDHVDQVLTAAAAVSGPALVLPAGHAGGRIGDPEGSQPWRVLIASDATDPVAGGAGALYERLQHAGMAATVLHVLTPATLPRIWEGVGHHAAAWRGELRHRHGPVIENMTVATGVPATEVIALAEDCDLVVLLWRQVTQRGRAAVVRAVLELRPSIPCLLVPVSWVRTLARNSVQTETKRSS